MSDDTSDNLAEIAIMITIYIVFGVFILAFKYPKVGIPLLVLIGLVLFFSIR